MSGTGPDRPALAAVLRALAGLYGTGVRWRTRLFERQCLSSRRLPCRVVSVGNIALGGTGKTPMTVYLARLFHGAGYRTAVVSRGYKGSAEGRGGVVSDGQRLLMGPAEAGDEPYLMARQLLPLGIAVLVGHDRVRSGRLALGRFQTEVILLDDGFQHRRLQRDLDLVLLDAANPFGNGYLLPRGPLREPLTALGRADACLLTRCPPAAIAPGAAGLRGMCDQGVSDKCRRPLFAAAHAPFVAERILAGRAEEWPDGPRPAHDPDAPVYAFSGLARNDAFRAGLREMGLALGGWTDFADHHVYTPADLRGLEARAARCGAGLMVTTQKDRVKIDAAWIGSTPLLVIGVRMDLGAYAQAFERFVLQRLDLPKRAAG